MKSGRTSIGLGPVLAVLWGMALAPADARAGSGQELFHAGLGFMFQNVGGRVAGTPSGSGTFFGTFTPIVHLSARLGSGSWQFVPTFRSGLPFLASSDSNSSASKWLLDLSLLVAKRWDGFDVHLGPGQWLWLYSGAGGSVTLNNGNSYDSFYLAGRNVWVREYIFQTGVGLDFPSSPLRVDLDWILTAPLSKERRASSVLLTLSLGFGSRSGT